MEVRHFEDWVGADVVDPAGTAVGKLEEVYFNGDSPTIALVRNGRVLKRRYVVPLKDAGVTRNRVEIAFAEGELLQAADGGHGLAAQDVDALGDTYGVRLAVPIDQLEGSSARVARLQAEAQAEQRAQALEADADQKARNAAAAAEQARAAEAAARDAEAERRAAAAQAEEARRAAP